jgi:hypothetical protein
MSVLDEALGQTAKPGQLAAVLDAGVGEISAEQSITFTKYVRVVLPLDGFVFWLNAKLLPPGGNATSSLPGQPQPSPQFTGGFLPPSAAPALGMLDGFELNEPSDTPAPGSAVYSLPFGPPSAAPGALMPGRRETNEQARTHPPYVVARFKQELRATTAIVPGVYSPGAMLNAPVGGLNEVELNQPSTVGPSSFTFVPATPLASAAIFNATAFNVAMIGAPFVQARTVSVQVPGSFHYDIERRQLHDQTTDINRVVFTARQPIGDLDRIEPDCLWLGLFDNPDASEGPIRFAFTRRQSFYQQADLYHYVGDAVYPFMESQIIDDLSQFNTRDVVVSNSLPIWLAMDQMNPPYPFPPRQNFPMFPSFLVPDDMEPPYASVHIVPESTEPITSAPFFNQLHSQYQLVKERVEITLYGLRNFNALDFMAYVQWMSEQDNAPFGVMNMPVIRDQKSVQGEISAIAMRKTVVFEINYYQSRVRDIAQVLILHVIPNYIIGG